MKMLTRAKPKVTTKQVAIALTFVALTAVAAGLVWGARRVSRKAEVQE